MKLNPQQKQAIQWVDQHCLLIAGAGSGKTRVINEKIQYLLNLGHDANKIFAVTFTNKAAREMQSRIQASQKLAKQNNVAWHDSKHLHISTFHRLGLNILRQECQRHDSPLDYRANFSILDSSDAQQICAEIIRQDQRFNMLDEKHVQWQISHCKNALVSPEQAIKNSSTDDELTIATLYKSYQEQLHAYNAVDFDDLIYLPMQLLQNYAWVKERWQNQIDFLLVDEYQDTNDCQYALIRLLLGEHARLTAVGDDDQSIYAWRGAKPENLHKLTQDFPKLQVIKLEQNYRSMGRILKCANAVIENNPHDFTKRLWSDLGYGDRVDIYHCATPEEEAERIVAEILHRKFQNNVANNDIAVLYRSNHQSRLIETALRTHNIPYDVSGGISFFERSEIKDILSYLRLLCNPTDDAAFLRIINTPRRDIGTKTLEKLAAVAQHSQCSLYEAARDQNNKASLGATAWNRLGVFVTLMENLESKLEELSGFAITKQLLEDIAYESWLQLTSKEQKQVEARLENVTALLDWIQQLNKKWQAEKHEAMPLQAVIDRLALLDIIDRQENEKNTGVQLMTIHAAKGLEFAYVYLVGMEEGVLPHFNSTEEQQIHEERRLAYVAITRAKKYLAMSYCNKRKRAGEWIDVAPSRFLEELPMDDIQWQGKTATDPEQERQRGKSSLASLKAMLNS